MRKLSKKISMLMVLAMLVGMFSGIVSASAASSWSFKSKNYEVAVDGTVVMGNKEYADFDLLKDGKAPTGYTVKWASSDENVVWVNAKTGQLRANKLGMANVGDKAVISATFTNTATKKSATRSFVIAYGEQEYELVAKVGDVVLGEETLLVGESYKLATTVLDEAGNSVDFKTCKLYRNYFIDGKAIANPYVPEKAGKVTIVVGAFAAKADMDDLSKAKFTEKFEVEATTGEFAAEADSIYTFKVTGKFAKDAAFKVVKNGTQKVAVKSVKVAEDGASAVITMTNKLVKGVYTITCDEKTVDVDVDDERAEKIVIYEADDVVYTGGSTPGKRDLVYVHYDVLNQYDDSIRKSTTIQWSANGTIYNDQKNLGILTIKNSGTADFRYGDLVVLNAVAMNNGKKPVNVQASMKVSLDHAASKVDVIGVVKNNSNVLLQEVPANFVGGEYSLVFKMFDRAGFEMIYSPSQAAADFTFNSMNPLLISNVKDDTLADFGTVYIDGVAYGTLALEPGIQAKFGGYAEIKAISNKTGIESNYDLRVVSDQIVQNFTILDPNGIVARNDVNSNATRIKLDYIALDEEGDEITDFRALYKAIGFSDRAFEMIESNEGKAELYYTVNVNTVKPEKTFDSPVIVTTILYTGSGNSSTKQLDIKLDRIASETSKYTGADTVLEGGNFSIKLPGNWDMNLFFLDQYGDELKSQNLFRSTKDVAAGAINYASGVLFEKRYVGVKIKKSVLPGDFTIGGAGYVTTVDGYDLFDPVVGNVISLTAGNNVTATVEEYPVEFVLYDQIKGEFVGGSELVVNFKVADLSQVVEFSVTPNDGFVEDANDKEVKVYNRVKGKLRNGKEVAVPELATPVTGNAIIVAEYTLKSYDYDGNQTLDKSADLASVGVVSGANAIVKLNTDHTVFTDVTNLDIYKDQSQKTADGLYKDRNLVYDVKVTVYSKGTDVGGADQFRGSAATTVEYGDVDRLYVSYNFNGNKPWINKPTDAYVKATDGVITYAELKSYIDSVMDNYGDKMGDTSRLAVLPIDITITKAAEGGKGLIEDGKLGTPYGMFSVVQAEASGTADMITGAEIGDKFIATYTIEGHPVTHSINFTVGSDNNAKFTTSNDICNYR